MILYQTQQFDLYFGNAQESISLQEIALQASTQSLKSIQKQLNAHQFVMLQQNHGTQGLYIQDGNNSDSYFSIVGDYIFTQKTACAIGVVTGDCLPIILYDPITHTAGIMHAGWKGLVADIFTICLDTMQKALNVQTRDLQIYLGPSARPCCYEVQQDFVDAFKKNRTDSDFFIQKNDKIFFDSRLFIRNIARNLGIKQENIYTSYNVCTICDVSFCSYRREKEKARRQITMICLR